MAFNCHLLWGDGLNVDINKSYGKFRASYNYTSSVANAVSIKYKLHSVGLELADVVCEKDRRKKEEKLRNITKAYRDKIGLGKKEGEKTPDQKNNLNELTMYEHRRWLVNIICNSYSVLNKDAFVNLKNTNKDKRNRLHTCLVPSNKEWALNEPEWTDLSKWNDKDIEKTDAFSKLDPLDKMSIMLNRHFIKLAKENNVEAVESDSIAIRRNLYDNPKALEAFNRYLISLRTLRATIESVIKGETIDRAKIENQQVLSTRQLNNFKKCLTDDVLNVSDINNRLNRIVDVFEPVKIACDFTDYKAKDHQLVSNIPFILNYSTSERICIPFVQDTNDNAWFKNVASSIVINPSVVTYLVDVDGNSKNILKDGLSNIARVMDNHCLQTKIALILYVKDGLFAEKKQLALELKEISSRIYSIEIVEIKNQNELGPRIKQTLQTNQNSFSGFSAIEINDGFISNAICSIEGLTIPTFGFDSMNKIFETVKSEDSYIWFKDIPFNTHINIEDMGRLSVYQEPELQKDYKDIWQNCYYDEVSAERYKKTQGWKCLCDAIKKKTEKDILISLSIKRNNNNKEELTDIFVPLFCKKSIEKIFAFLSSSQIIDDFAILEHNSAMLKVCFKSTKATSRAFLRLFKNPYSLIDESKVKTISNGKFIQIVFDYLNINDFAWDKVREELKNEYNLEELEFAENAFDYFVAKGYVIKLSNYNFCFASHQIKRLLTDEEHLLKIYTYYQLVENGNFDEIRPEVKIKCQQSDYEDMLNLVAVKGFRSQIVEVKATSNLPQDFYQKLKENGDRFGINKDLILIADVGDGFSENEEFIKLGQEHYGIRTITDIGNVSEQLMNIMKGIN